MAIEPQPTDKAQEINNHADGVWQTAKDIETGMPDIARELKETASHLHALASAIRRRRKFLEGIRRGDRT